LSPACLFGARPPAARPVRKVDDMTERRKPKPVQYPTKQIKAALARCHTRGAVERALRLEIPALVHDWLRQAWSEGHGPTHADAMHLARLIHRDKLADLVALAHDRIDRPKRRPDKKAEALSKHARFGPRELSDEYGVPYQALRKRLNRRRAADKTFGKENADRKPTESQWLYTLSEALPVIEAMKAGSKRAAQKKTR